MRKRTVRNILIGAAMLAAFFIFVTTLVGSLWYAPEKEGAPPKNAGAGAASGPTSSLPSELVIPALNIDARVQFLGINTKGNMMAPSNFTDVGWYKYGTVPGNIGSAVMDGHVDNGLGLAGVFKHLDGIVKGDDVYVVTRTGAKLHFVVDDIEAYPYNALPPDTIFGAADAARLNLITCEGNWVPGGDTYDHRLVVFAKLVAG